MFGVIPLHMACEKGRDGVVKLLIERGANLHIKEDFDSHTPLDKAKHNRSNVTVSILENTIKERNGE